MQRLLSALAGVAVSLAIAGSAPAQAASPRAAPAALTVDQPAASMETVSDRRWGHRRRGHDDFGIGFSFGFGAPFFGHHPYSYAYRPYHYAPACPYGSWYDPRYGACVVAYQRAPSYRYYGGPGGLPLDYRENHRW